MNLFENPFFLLDAGPETSREELATRVEQFVSTATSPAVAARARSILHARERLGAEVAWLPGMDHPEAHRWLGRLRSRPSGFPGYSGEVHGLDGFNLAVTALELSGTPLSTDHLVRWIVVLARTEHEIDPDRVGFTIDRARDRAGFATVDDRLEVVRAIESRLDQGISLVERLLAASPITEAADALAEALRTCAVIDPGPAGTFLFMLISTHEKRVADTCRGLLEQALSLLSAGPLLPGDRGVEEDWLSALDNRLRTWRRLAAPMIVRSDLAGIPWTPLLEAHRFLSDAVTRSGAARRRPGFDSRVMELVVQVLRTEANTPVAV